METITVRKVIDCIIAAQKSSGQSFNMMLLHPEDFRQLSDGGRPLFIAALGVTLYANRCPQIAIERGNFGLISMPTPHNLDNLPAGISTMYFEDESYNVPIMPFPEWEQMEANVAEAERLIS